MVAPYRGHFRVTQIYNPPTHKGLDLVGIDSESIYSTINGTVMRSGWENPSDHSQGWGMRIAIKETGSNRWFYFGHLSSIAVVVNQVVTIGEYLGEEGNTGYSTGSHLHYESRYNDDSNQPLNISSISGIPNELGVYDAGGGPTPVGEFPYWLTPFIYILKKRGKL